MSRGAPSENFQKEANDKPCSASDTFCEPIRVQGWRWAYQQPEVSLLASIGNPSLAGRTTDKTRALIRISVLSPTSVSAIMILPNPPSPDVWISQFQASLVSRIKLSSWFHGSRRSAYRISPISYRVRAGEAHAQLNSDVTGTKHRPFTGYPLTSDHSSRIEKKPDVDNLDHIAGDTLIE